MIEKFLLPSSALYLICIKASGLVEALVTWLSHQMETILKSIGFFLTSLSSSLSLLSCSPLFRVNSTLALKHHATFLLISTPNSRFHYWRFWCIERSNARCWRWVAKQLFYLWNWQRLLGQSAARIWYPCAKGTQSGQLSVRIPNSTRFSHQLC